MTVEIPFGSHEAVTNAQQIYLTVAWDSLYIDVKTGCYWNQTCRAERFELHTAISFSTGALARIVWKDGGKFARGMELKTCSRR